MRAMSVSRPGTSSRPLVTLDGLDVAIDGNVVLHDISLAIAAETRLGVVGANGSGKSSLLGLLAGTRWPVPRKGRRIYDFGDGPERDAVAARQQLTLLGHELQNLYAARNWNFRVLDVVHSGLTRSDIPKRRRTRAMLDEAAQLLDRASLGHLAERRILELSRGEQRRVLITRAIAFRPSILLLDEPMSGLDAHSRQQLETTLAALTTDTPLVIAAHNEDDLPACVTEVRRLDAGRLSAPVRRSERQRTADAQGSIYPGSSPATSGTAPGSKAAVSGKQAGEAGTTAAESPDTIIELTNASAFIDGVEVLRSVSWQLRRGEHWLIEGPNGSGKSTLLRMLHGEIRPARGGTVRWPGLGNPKNVWELRRRICLVSPEFQARYRYPTTVFAAIASGFHASVGLTRRLSNAERDQVHALLEELQLQPFAGRLLTQLSYGQCHRTLIARTLATEPDVLLLDEPWEGLDRTTISLISASLARRINTGTQVICASHTGAAGLPVNRRLSIRDGRVRRAGDSA